MAAGDASGEGDFRILFADSSETQQTQIFSDNTTVLDLSTDPRQLTVLPMSQNAVHEDDKVIIQMKPYADADVATDPTESATHSLIRIPVTYRNVSTGNIYVGTLTTKDFNAAATNYSPKAGLWMTIGTYTVPAQLAVKLGVAIPDNSRIRVELKTAA